MKKVYYKEIPAFITKIINHIGYQLQIFQVKDMFNLNYEVFSKEEEKVKDYLDTYIYLLNNSSNIISLKIISKSIYLLNNQRIKKERIEKIISNFISIKQEVNVMKIIDVSYQLSRLIRNKKDQYIYFLMLINYLLIHYEFKLVKYYDQDFVILDQIIKEYEKGNKNLLERYITYKQELSRTLEEGYYQNLKKISLDEIIEYIKTNEEIFKEKYQVESLAIFGSFVKGKERLDSDIDLLIRFKPFLPLLRRNCYLQEIQELVKYKFNRFCDIHVESDILSEHEIKIFKENIKII